MIKRVTCGLTCVNNRKMKRNNNKFIHGAIYFLLLVSFFFCTVSLDIPAAAKKKFQPEKILYIPHDNRPIVLEQTTAILEKVGYEVITPPTELLGNRENFGEPEKLWEWLDKNTDQKIRAAVISSDAMLYGSLVASRKHTIDQETILNRVDLFQKFRKDHKKLPIYVFGSIMRTPRNATASGYEEPDYYRNYGANIFRYTALEDKREVEGLTLRESKEIDFLRRLIPARALSDWKDRHEKNFNANEKLIDLAKEKNFNVLLLGRDDNAPYSQTHMESRHLKNYSKGIGIEQENFQTIAGIDEVGLMLLTRAVNERLKNSPSIFVKYNWGRGGETVPSYSDETIQETVDAEILACGAKKTDELSQADIIFAVNTPPNGQTFEASSGMNDKVARVGTEFFADTVQDFLDSSKPVVVADVAFANGSDNALMEMLNKRGLLFKLNAYGGWNTATNSSGFALATGILSRRMTYNDKKNLLITRYLDDWAYQANVRNIVAGQLKWLRGDGFYESLNDKTYVTADDSARMLANFIKNNLQTANISEKVTVEFPWNRMFESRIIFNVQ